MKDFDEFRSMAKADEFPRTLNTSREELRRRRQRERREAKAKIVEAKTFVTRAWKYAGSHITGLGPCIEHGAESWLERDDQSQTGWALRCTAGSYYRVAKSRTDLLKRIAEVVPS